MVFDVSYLHLCYFLSIYIIFCAVHWMTKGYWLFLFTLYAIYIKILFAQTTRPQCLFPNRVICRDERSKYHAGQCCYCEDGDRCPAEHNNSAQGDIFEILWGKVELCGTHKFIDKFTYVRWKKQTSCLVAPVFHLVVETYREFVQLVNVCLCLFFSSGFIWLPCIPLFGMLVEFGKEGFRFSLSGNYDFLFFFKIKYRWWITDGCTCRERLLRVLIEALTTWYCWHRRAEVVLNIWFISAYFFWLQSCQNGHNWMSSCVKLHHEVSVVLEASVIFHRIAILPISVVIKVRQHLKKIYN